MRASRPGWSPSPVGWGLRAAALGALLLSVLTPADGQHPARVELGWGTLSPGDPFQTTLSFRAAAGIAAGARNAFMLEYTRQSANRSEGADVGKFASQFLGAMWQHAFRDTFGAEEPRTQQYLLRIAAGYLFRGKFRGEVGSSDLANSLYAGAGAVIRYPLADRFALVGTIEDAVTIVPHQVVSSYCTAQSDGTTFCYPTGGPTYYAVTIPGGLQHNFGAFIALEWYR